MEDPKYQIERPKNSKKLSMTLTSLLRDAGRNFDKVKRESKWIATSLYDPTMFIYVSNQLGPRGTICTFILKKKHWSKAQL